jgi:hypothetical protein
MPQINGPSYIFSAGYYITFESNILAKRRDMHIALKGLENRSK